MPGGINKMSPAPPELEEYPPAHLWKPEHLLGNTLMLHVDTCKVGITLFQPSTRRALSLRTDFTGVGGPKPQAAPLLEKYSVPFVVGLVKNGSFLTGDNASSYWKAMCAEDMEERMKYWELGSLLTEESGYSVTPGKVEYAEGNKCQVSLELLLVIFFRALINGVLVRTSWDKRQNSYVEISDEVIFSVPLWFPALARIRLRNAAKVLELKATFVNDCTVAAYIQQHRLPTPQFPAADGLKEPERKILVFSENSGNIDLALYVAAGDKMTLVACAGNMYKCPYKDLTKITQEDQMNMDFATVDHAFKIRYNAEKDKPLLRITLIQGLLQEIEGQIPKEVLMDDIGQNINIVFLAEDPSWEQLFMAECCALFGIDQGTVEPQEGYQLELEECTRSVYWLDLDYVTMLEKLMEGTYVLEIPPYELYGKFFLEWTTVERKLLSADAEKLMRTTFPQKIVVFEKYCNDWQLPVATLTIPKLTYYKHDRLSVDLEWASLQGICTLIAIYGHNARGEQSEALPCPEDYQWEDVVLSPEKRDQLWEVCEKAWDYAVKHKTKYAALIQAYCGANRTLQECMEKGFRVNWQQKLEDFYELLQYPGSSLTLNEMDEMTSDFQTNCVLPTDQPIVTRRGRMI